MERRGRSTENIMGDMAKTEAAAAAIGVTAVGLLALAFIRLFI